MFQKLFKGYIFCFLGHLVGRYIFELSARETNLMKKRTVRLTVQLVENLLSENQFCSGVYLEGGMLLAPHKGFWVNFISCKDDDIDEKKAAIYDQESLFLPA